MPSVGGLFPPQREYIGAWGARLGGGEGSTWGKDRGGELGQGKGRAWGKAGAGAGSTHDLARMLLPLDLRGYYFIS